MSRHGVYFFDAVYLIIPKHDTQYVIGICQKDVYRITLYAEIPTVQLNVVTHIKTIHQPAEEHVAVDALSFFHLDYIIIKVRRISHTVNARYR